MECLSYSPIFEEVREYVLNTTNKPTFSLLDAVTVREWPALPSPCLGHNDQHETFGTAVVSDLLPHSYGKSRAGIQCTEEVPRLSQNRMTHNPILFDQSMVLLCSAPSTATRSRSLFPVTLSRGQGERERGPRRRIFVRNNK